MGIVTRPSSGKPGSWALVRTLPLVTVVEAVAPVAVARQAPSIRSAVRISEPVEGWVVALLTLLMALEVMTVAPRGSQRWTDRCGRR